MGRFSRDSNFETVFKKYKGEKWKDKDALLI